MSNRTLAYFKESRDELRKVVWPTRQKTLNDTLLVIAISLVVAAFLGVIDYALNLALEQFVVR